MIILLLKILKRLRNKKNLKRKKNPIISLHIFLFFKIVTFNKNHKKNIFIYFQNLLYTYYLFLNKFQVFLM